MRVITAVSRLASLAPQTTVGAQGWQWKKWRVPVRYIVTPAPRQGVDDVLVADGAAGLDDRLDAGVDEDLRRRRRRGRTRRRPRPSRRLVPRRACRTREPAGVDPVDLAHADADRGAAEASRIALDFTARQAARRRRGRRASPRRAGSPVARVQRRRVVAPRHGVDRVAGLHQQAAGDARVSMPPRVAGTHSSSRMFFLSARAAPRPRRRRSPGATTTSVKISPQLLGHRHRDRHVGRDHPAERRDRVARVRLAVRLGDVRADRDAARVGVLDDRDGRLVEVVRRATGRIGVDVVVVGHLLAVQLRRLREAAVGREAAGVERRRAGAGSPRSAAPRPCPRSPPTHAGKPVPSEVSVTTLPIQDATCDVVRRGVHERLGREPLRVGRASSRRPVRRSAARRTARAR